MSPINSRRKGKTGERDVIRILRKHLGGKWERRPPGVPGPDITTPKAYPWAVEVKNYKGVKLKHLFRPTHILKAFWRQAFNQAVATGKEPLLVVKMEGIWMATLGGETLTLPEYSEWCELDALCRMVIRQRAEATSD